MKVTPVHFCQVALFLYEWIGTVEPCGDACLDECQQFLWTVNLLKAAIDCILNA